jgi:hypothetical protein
MPTVTSIEILLRCTDLVVDMPGDVVVNSKSNTRLQVDDIQFQYKVMRRD